ARWPSRLRAEALAGEARADRDLDAISAFFDLASEVAGGGAAGIRALLGSVAAQQIPADRTRESRLGSRGVALLTAHRSRGRQWRLVVVAGVQEGTWPAGRGVSAVLEPARLLSAGIGPRPEARERLAEERRLFFIACSRASEHLVVSCAAGPGGDAAQPSRFISELGVAPAAVVAEAPVTLVGLVGGLRRVLVSPGESPARQEAAARELAVLADARDQAGRGLVPLADPQRWWGVLPLPSGPTAVAMPSRLSPSQVEGLLTCPRRYFLSRSARADAVPGPSAALGSVLHLLIEHAAAGDLAVSELAGSLDRAWNELRFETDWLSEVERAEAEAALQRYLAWQQGRASRMVGVEVPFTVSLEVDGRTVEVAGKVDRLERTEDGRLAVVDFKTGRTVPTAAEVAAMDQLGIYQLAVEQGAFAHLAPEASGTAGAWVVYLREPARRQPWLPKELGQDPLGSRPHLDAGPDEAGYPTWVHHRVAQAAATVAAGRYPAATGGHCRSCRFADSCPASGRGRQVVE
ncbi:MAG: PD-(D/E)XK nuclease family protein, partial [Propionicimonas sp.]|nr:PD-(D/E)XK nuclease family protein [Propionicimonas sp.]